MSKTSGNLELNKPDGTDQVKLFRAPFNENMDIIDQAVSGNQDSIEEMLDVEDNLASAMGIVEDGNAATHAIEAGQYVIWKKALYTADAAITIGETLAASGGSKNLTACTEGGFNALNASMPYLDTGNVLYTFSGSGSYTATENCILAGSVSSVPNLFYFYIDSVQIGLAGGANNSYYQVFIPCKKGQTLTITFPEGAASANLRVFKAA